MQIRQPEFHEAATTAALGFVKYRIVLGEPVTRNRFLPMTLTERDVAQFLQELHAVQFDLPRAQQMPVFAPRQR